MIETRTFKTIGMRTKQLEHPYERNLHALELKGTSETHKVFIYNDNISWPHKIIGRAYQITSIYKHNFYGTRSSETHTFFFNFKKGSIHYSNIMFCFIYISAAKLYIAQIISKTSCKHLVIFKWNC